MTQLLNAISKRFSCRQYTKDQVSEAELGVILEAGRIAPSAFGMEPWRFIVVQSPAAKEKVASACNGQDPATTAPVLIAVVALVDALAPGSDFVEARLKAEAGGNPPSDELREAYQDMHGQIDLTSWSLAQCNFAAAQMMIQAAGLGLASCAMGGFDEQALSEALNLTQGEAPALVLAIGHCAEAQGERRRRSMDEVLSIA